MTYRQVIEDWNGKIGLPAPRAPQPGLEAQAQRRSQVQVETANQPQRRGVRPEFQRQLDRQHQRLTGKKPSWSGEPAHRSKHHRPRQ